MYEFAEGNELYQRAYFKKHEEELLALAQKGQNPKALFIGCSDSRVIPDPMLQTKPGDLFVIRNVGKLLKEEKLFIHDWYYDIETGSIQFYDPDRHELLPLGSLAEKCKLALSGKK